ncbi:hypothetical protein ACJX0J_036096, partial [Zea mays]
MVAMFELGVCLWKHDSACLVMWIALFGISNEKEIHMVVALVLCAYCCIKCSGSIYCEL